MEKETIPMKRTAWLLIPVIFAIGALTTYLFAQAPQSAPGGKVADALALLKDGQPQQAKELVATIPEGDPEYPAAQCCKALCLYELKDNLGFLNVMKSPVIPQAEIAPAIREDLDYKHIDALFQYRQFEELLPKTDDFAARHTGSEKLPTVTEYQSAALYERGMKKLTESGFLRSRGDLAGAEKRLKEGQENLGHFLKLSAGRPGDGYQTLTNRNAQAELVKALTALGGEQEVLKMAGLAEREATALAILQLCIKTKPEAVDDNLLRMTNFLHEFPKNRYASRVRYEMALAAKEEGWRLHFMFQSAGAATCLDKAHSMLREVVTDNLAGVSDADVMEATKGIMQVYYAKRDWANLSNWVAQHITNLPKGGKEWLAFKLYDAAGLACQRKTDEASKELDELLETGFKGNPSYDGLLVSAAKWRVRIANWTGDEATIKKVVALVESSDCPGSLKRAFAKDCKEIVSQHSKTSK
jgi:tetratricopeptide (TPR) repeat protein